MSDWIPAEIPPIHGQKVKTRSADGRGFECEYFHWNCNTKPYFKLIGKVWNHDNVTHWMPLSDSNSQIKSQP